MNNNSSGKFVYSLDFELLWGVLDIEGVEGYKKNILDVWEALPQMLNIFEEYKVQGTFATVGFLFASNSEELVAYSPKIKPDYSDEKFSPYKSSISPFVLKEFEDKLYFASELIDLIASKNQHEISTHTFSHYYCLENGPSIEAFKADIKSAIDIAKNKNISLNSIIFPRNQYSKEHLDALPELGINSYRGNPDSWCYNSFGSDSGKFHMLMRITRLCDDYLNLTGHHCYSMDEVKKSLPHNFPASKFLRPYTPALRAFNKLRLKRIKRSMTYAAKNNKVYHLWSHPHNFGRHIKDNLDFLKEIFIHYKHLNKKYNFQSITMNDLSKEINNINKATN